MSTVTATQTPTSPAVCKHAATRVHIASTHNAATYTGAMFVNIVTPAQTLNTLSCHAISTRAGVRCDEGVCEASMFHTTCCAATSMPHSMCTCLCVCHSTSTTHVSVMGAPHPWTSKRTRKRWCVWVRGVHVAFVGPGCWRPNGNRKHLGKLPLIH